MVSKKKSSNPLDVHRKAARSRELKKNKDQREKAREISLVKRDTHAIEKEIQQLQSSKSRSADDDKELSKLLLEVKKIKQAKEEYLSKHPEHRQFVYPGEAGVDEKHSKRNEGSGDALQRQVAARDPRRSIYYDATFNPFGAPPPGMPYREKTDQQWEEEQRKLFKASQGSDGNDGGSKSDDNDEVSEADDDHDDESDDSDEEIVMPEGPHPLTLPAHQSASIKAKAAEKSEESSEDEDGIVMPKGPPPAPPSAPRAMLQAQTASPHSGPRPSASNWQPPLPPTPPPKAFHTTHVSARPQQYAQAEPTPQPPTAASATVITSAPVLRDLKKEVTAFVPTALRKKQGAPK